MNERAVTASDREFLLDVFAHTRRDELAGLGLERSPESRRPAVDDVRAVLVDGERRDRPAVVQPIGGGQQRDQMPSALAATGGSQPHDDMQPYLGMTYIIALEGVFPSRP